jgi:hypothetical protein
VQGDIAAIDSGLHRGGAFGNAPTGTEELAVDRSDVEPAGVIPSRLLVRAAFFGGGDVGVGALFLEFHRTRRMVMAFQPVKSYKPVHA